MRPEISHSPAGIARSKATSTGAGIGNRFSLEFRFLYLKIARQHVGIADEASDAAISVLEYDEVKLATASRNLSRNLTDSPE
jgi:hypothetical protein